MKKIVTSLFMFFCIGCFFLPAATNQKSKKTEPTYTLDSGKAMDRNWDQYYSTGDETYLENIIAYADTEDLLLKNINKSFKKFSKDEKFIGILKEYGANVTNKSIEFDFDFEMTVPFLINNPEEEEKIKYIYSFFPNDLFIRGVMKGTACWSLVSNAEQYETISIALQKHIPYMNKKAQTLFYSMLELDKEIGLVRAEKGQAIFQNNDIWISAILVNDLQAALDQWASLDVEEAPKLSPSTEVNPRNLDIAPFICFSCGNQLKYPVYWDCELIEPDSNASPNKAEKLVLISQKPQRSDLIYCSEKNCGWRFDDTDPAGNYIVRITLYSENKVIAVLELPFKLKKK